MWLGTNEYPKNTKTSEKFPIRYSNLTIMFIFINSMLSKNKNDHKSNHELGFFRARNALTHAYSTFVILLFCLVSVRNLVSLFFFNGNSLSQKGLFPKKSIGKLIVTNEFRSNKSKGAILATNLEQYTLSKNIKSI